jgi:hypothetical protein
MATHGGLDDPTANGPRLLLADHHDVIDEKCRDLEAAIHQDDPRELVSSFRVFEDAMLDHLWEEEEEILPSYALFDWKDAQDVRRQHTELRKQLNAIGVDVELHGVRAIDLKHLMQLLRAHAKHEDSRMYPWAQVNLPLSTRRRLFLRVGRSIRMLRDLRRMAWNRARGDQA